MYRFPLEEFEAVTVLFGSEVEKESNSNSVSRFGWLVSLLSLSQRAQGLLWTKLFRSKYCIFPYTSVLECIENEVTLFVHWDVQNAFVFLVRHTNLSVLFKQSVYTFDSPTR